MNEDTKSDLLYFIKETEKDYENDKEEINEEFQVIYAKDFKAKLDIQRIY